jgi:hypothetical protein
MFALKLPGSACSRAAAIVIKWIAVWADPSTNKKAKKIPCQPLQPVGQTTLNMEEIRWFKTVPRLPKGFKTGPGKIARHHYI